MNSALKTTLRTAALFASGAAVFTLAGCHGASDPKAPISASPDTITRAQWPRIEVEPELAGWIAVNEPIVTNDDVMKVQVPIRLLSDAGQYARIQYRFVFFGANGTPLNDQAQWKYMRLEPRTPTFISGNSTDHATDWRCEIRMNR